MAVTNESLIKPEGRVLATLEADGHRRWLEPKLSKGRFLKWRRIVAYALIVWITALPFVIINGKPAVLLDMPARKFTLFGYTFLPTDTVLLALLMVAGFAFIFLSTAIAGRAWCGWACPQTVYMEFVYRPIERLFLGRAGVGGKPRAGLGSWRYVLMYLAFAVISLFVTHTLLSYFVGVKQLQYWVISNPVNHPAEFTLIAISSAAVFFNFAYFREQMCLIACPYGRFQSVMLDRHSLAVSYDRTRGEPRAKGKRQPLTILNQIAKNVGDCIDCTMCVQVCPTGIDIRDGQQMECINCAQCIDACDSVMDKVGLPRGLVGYSSEAMLAKEPRRVIRPRVVLYTTITLLFSTVLTVMIITKQPFDASLVRNGGLPFAITPEGAVENTMRLTLRNRSESEQTIALVIETAGVQVPERERLVSVPAGETIVHPLHFMTGRAGFTGGKRSADIRLMDQSGAERRLTFELFGPGVLQ